MCQDISVYLVLCIGVLVAILAVFVNDHDKRLEALDSLSTHLGKRVENLTRENEKLTEIIEGRFVDYLKVGHAQVLNFQPPFISGQSLSCCYDFKQQILKVSAFMHGWFKIKWMYIFSKHDK